MSVELNSRVVRARGQRILWLDYAKAFAILAVVITHVITKFVIPLDMNGSQLLLGFVVAFQPLRMPIFFLVSGLLGASAQSMPWSEVLRRKTGSYYYIYVVWLVLQTVLFLSLPRDIEIPTAVANDIPSFISQLTYNPSNLWYLWALALFFPIAKLGIAIPRLTLGISLLVATVAAMGMLSQLQLLSTALLNLPWFLAGAYFSNVFLSIAESRQKRNIWLSVICFMGLLSFYLIVRIALGPIFSGLVYNFLALSGIAAIIVLFPRVSSALRKWRLLNELIVYIGKNTVQIYVLHVPIITVTAHFFGFLSGGLALAIALVILTTILIVLSSLLLGSGVQKVFPFLFSPPKWVTEKGRTVTGV
ncbi:acyltransferase [Yaniella flava]|uniref:acyltransferase n=1 Tax=Yaniella flava TaxID=287930 RepID=UPI0031E18EDB